MCRETLRAFSAFYYYFTGFVVYFIVFMVLLFLLDFINHLNKIFLKARLKSRLNIVSEKNRNKSSVLTQKIIVFGFELMAIFLLNDCYILTDNRVGGCNRNKSFIY